MRSFPRKGLKQWLYLAAVLSVAASALMDASCGRRKDGILVDVSDELNREGVAIRDWRRSGMGVLDVQIFSHRDIPANAWTLAAYDKAGTLLTSGRVMGPRARQGDLIWIRLTTPYRDLFDKADRVVIGADFSAPSAPIQS
jgi:hypothetical protein